MRGAAVAAIILFFSFSPIAAEGPQIAGDYVEIRTADVYTGPCFANGEVGLTGRDAVLAWRVREGSWDGVRLDGLSVLAVVRAQETLGDPYSDPLPARSVMVVDEAATEKQRAALVSFARAQNPALFAGVEAVEAAPISFEFDRAGRHDFVTVEAGELARISTRAIREGDHICRNETVFYPPLIEGLEHSMPVVATDGGYQGNHLGKKWRERERRGSFVGTFSF